MNELITSPLGNGNVHRGTTYTNFEWVGASLNCDDTGIAQSGSSFFYLFSSPPSRGQPLARTDDNFRTYTPLTLPYESETHFWAQGVTAGNGKIVVVGSDTFSSTFPKTAIWVSTDNGSSFTRYQAFAAESEDSSAARYYYDLTWAGYLNGKYICSCYYPNESTTAVLLHSSDGVNWTKKGVRVSSDESEFGAYGNSLYMFSSPDVIHYTTDLSTISSYGFLSSKGLSPSGIASNGSVFVVVCSSSNVYTSTTGSEWTARAIGIDDMAADSVAYCTATNEFVICGWDIAYENFFSATSSDGITWVNSIPALQDRTDQIYVNGYVVPNKWTNYLRAVERND